MFTIGRRLRKDVAEAGAGGGMGAAAFDTLHDTRALEFEVDSLGQKLKRWGLC